MLRPFRFSNNDKYRTEETKVKNNLADENGYLFQRYLFYAEEGGIIYNYYVGKAYVYGVEKGNKSYPQGLQAELSKAVPFLEYASERECEEAQLLLGLVYLGWYDENYKDEAKAAKWLGRAARLGDRDAQFWYGDLLQEGIGVQQNAEEAYYWFLESGNHGHAGAMTKLCHYYMDKLLEFPEEMTDEEDEEFQEYVWDSFCWAKYAADYGSDEGMYLTGMFYFQGFGGTKDLELSRKYLDLAVQNGNEDAKRFIDEKF